MARVPRERALGLVVVKHLSVKVKSKMEIETTVEITRAEVGDTETFVNFVQNELNEVISLASYLYADIEKEFGEKHTLQFFEEDFKKHSEAAMAVLLKIDHDKKTIEFKTGLYQVLMFSLAAFNHAHGYLLSDISRCLARIVELLKETKEEDADKAIEQFKNDLKSGLF